ncbi:hypothetical protein [Natrialba swarupiae]|uniref:Proton-conducting membrane transporter n=1 Tax=Natrialba swarupiae TaxID=2448032 RepID=A0A5D5AJA5_9EURY|nr:hypothetical protein [Natrialba swarupiae]TYT61023.1 hypothetical protein FYC77_15675 [Natrialba swarupiae]
MTRRPELRLGTTLAPGILAVVLFGMMGLIAWNTQFGGMAGFPDGISITSEIGYAMFDLEPLQSEEGAIGETEAFLAAFLLIAITLDAALDASLVLAKREESGESVTALISRSGDSTSAATGAAAADDRSTATDGGRDSDASTATADSSEGGESR